MINELNRLCPHCRKEISAKATRCKHCLELVNAIRTSPAVASTSDAEWAEPQQSASKPGRSDDIPVLHSRCKYRYQVVPFIGSMRSGFFSNDSAQTVSTQLNNLLAHYAQQGWEFHSVAKVDIQVTPGCIGQLLGQSASYIRFDQVIFRQET